MVSPLSAKEKLRIQFRKSLRKGYTRNAEMDPVVPEGLFAMTEPEETIIVRVDSTKGQHYWFTDRRLLCQHADGIHEMLRYQSVMKAHWMFKDFWTDRVKSLAIRRSCFPIQVRSFRPTRDRIARSTRCSRRPGPGVLSDPQLFLVDYEDFNSSDEGFLAPNIESLVEYLPRPRQMGTFLVLVVPAKPGQNGATFRRP